MSKVTKATTDKRCRQCPECKEKMELSGFVTRALDFWQCPKCGYWNQTLRKS